MAWVRQADLYEAALEHIAFPSKPRPATLDQVTRAAQARPASAALALPPLIHGAAEWFALGTVFGGGTVVLAEPLDGFSPILALEAAVRWNANTMILVGDAFARPLCAALRNGHGASSLQTIVSGGAPLSPAVRRDLLECLPGLRIIDAGGSSETGRALFRQYTTPAHAQASVFRSFSRTRVLDEAKQAPLPAGHAGLGWLATTGPLPLGYLGDERRSRTTFPTIAGERVAVTGDRVRLRPDGLVEFIGRASGVINTGGEKVFAEEVEQALLTHQAVHDAIVVGRPSERWGQEVVAIVQLAEDADQGGTGLRRYVAGILARYKIPKEIYIVDRVRRTASGKADYGWARSEVSRASATDSRPGEAL